MRIRIENLKGIATMLQNRKKNDFLSGKSMEGWDMIKNAYIEIESGYIHDFGKMSDCPKSNSNVKIIDGTGRFLLPGLIDSHTHLVYHSDRSEEFNLRMHGSSYEEIASSGGGILNSAKKMHDSDEEELLELLLERLDKSKSTGTTAIEIKSGYGLTLDSETKILRVIQKAKTQVTQKIWATFLGAHALPASFNGDSDSYIDEVCLKMLPSIADKGLIDFVDIFCEKNYFSPRHIDQLSTSASKYNIPLKAHVNQFNSIGGIQAAINNSAWSVDHLECLTASDLNDLIVAFNNESKRKTIPVALPGCSLFLDIPFAPAREIIDSNLPLAIASDCNPGSAPSSNLMLCWSLACHKMKLTPKEGLASLTANASYALGAQENIGSISKGMIANLILTKPISSFAYLPYSFGENNIEKTFINGK